MTRGLLIVIGMLLVALISRMMIEHRQPERECKPVLVFIDPNSSFL